MGIKADSYPTVKEKSRSYANGLPSPLLPMTRIVHSPELIWSFSRGHVESWEVLLGTEKQRNKLALISISKSTMRWMRTGLDRRALPLVFGGLLHQQNMSAIVVAAIELLHCSEIYGAVRIDEVASAIDEINAIDFACRIRIVLSSFKQAERSCRSSGASEQPYNERHHDRQLDRTWSRATECKRDSGT